MSESLLGQFALDENVFRLGQYSPISIRDQIVRAHYLVELLRIDRVINAQSRIAVIGAGAAGITAAAYANQLGVAEVHLVEAASHPMPLQANCRTRILDPVQYDWPALHWKEAQWPLPEPNPRKFTATQWGAPVILRTAAAAIYARDYQTYLLGQLASPRFSFYPNYTARAWDYDANNKLVVPIDLTSSQLAAELHVDVAIYATGIGTEIAQIPYANTSFGSGPFEGINFWQDDVFESQTFGLGGHHHVLVSGAGDGGLQDFIRLVTGQSTAHAVLKAVLDAIQHSCAWRAELDNLWHWEDHARRTSIMAPDRARDCLILARLHERHLNVIDAIKHDAKAWSEITKALNKMTNGRPLKQIVLSFPCVHFTWCYALNRFVALLLAQYIRDHWHSEPLQPSQSAIQTSAAHPKHACAKGCWGASHEVRFATNVTCATSHDKINAIRADDSHPDSRWETYDGLVVRHGIETQWLKGVAPRLLPQHVPFHLP